MTKNNINAFEILLAYDQMINSSFDEFDSNYLQYTNDQAASKIKHIFDMITNKFRRQDELLKVISDKRNILKEIDAYTQNKMQINEMIFHMTQLHVDEPGFRAQMNELAQQMKVLADHDETCLHRKLKVLLEDKQLTEANNKLLKKFAFSSS